MPLQSLLNLPTDNRHTSGTRVILELVVDTLDQRIFRPYHHHIDAIVNRKLLQSLKVIGLYSHILTTRRCTSVAWCDEKFLDFCTLGYLPSQGVLTAATS